MDLGAKEKISLIEEELKEKRELNLHWNKILVPMLTTVCLLLVLVIGGMIYELKSLELVAIVIFLIYSFVVTAMLLLTGRLGLQLAILKMPFMRNMAGDTVIKRYKKSGRSSYTIEKYASLKAASEDKTSVTTLMPASFTDENTGLPEHVIVEGFPLSIDPRKPYDDSQLSKHSKIIGHGFIEHYHQGLQEGFKSIDKLFKYLKWILIGILILIVVTGATLYFANNVGTFVEKIEPTVTKSLNDIDTYLKSLPPPALPNVPSSGGLTPAG